MIKMNAFNKKDWQGKGKLGILGREKALSKKFKEVVSMRDANKQVRKLTKHLNQWFLNVNMHQNHSEDLLKPRLLRDFGLAVLGEGARICASLTSSFVILMQLFKQVSHTF